MPVAINASAQSAGWRDYTYLLLLVALIPLAHSLMAQKEDDLKERIRKTAVAHPEAFTKDASDDDVLSQLPEHRIEGAALPRDTKKHWGYAAMSSAAFMAVLLLL